MERMLMLTEAVGNPSKFLANFIHDKLGLDCKRLLEYDADKLIAWFKKRYNLAVDMRARVMHTIVASLKSKTPEFEDAIVAFSALAAESQEAKKINELKGGCNTMLVQFKEFRKSTGIDPRKK